MDDRGRLVAAGYLPKIVAYRPEYPHTPPVSHVLSVSHHLSSAPDGWIDSWLHNDLGFFNRLADARAVVPPDDAGRYRLFAYRLLPQVFVAGKARPAAVPVNVQPEPVPEAFVSLGFDAVSHWSPGLASRGADAVAEWPDDVLGFECSPLSCNGLAAEIETTDGCLFPTLDAAIAGALQFARDQPEPGDYYVLEVLEAARR